VLVLAMSQVAVVLSGGGGGGGEYQCTAAQVVPVVAKYGAKVTACSGACGWLVQSHSRGACAFPKYVTSHERPFNSRDTTNCHWGTLQSIVCKGAVHSVVSLAGTA
jgi:hypothetical protein